MISFIIRCLLTATALAFNTYLFYSGSWGWGISFILITALLIFSFFRNENMILALNQMRVGNTEKAKKHINKITHPQLMPKKQHAYILYLQAVMNTQEFGLAKSEQLLRKALGLGLRTKQDQAVARMHLQGFVLKPEKRCCKFIG